MFGRRLRDREGRTLDRAFLLFWRGRITVVGISPYSCLKLTGIPQERLSYWKQEICWEQASVPDFQRIGKPPISSRTGVVCHALISHLQPDINCKMLDEWQKLDPASNILLLHGGSREDFDALPDGINAIYIPDKSLRTKDHAREKQQYTGVLRAIAEWLKHHPEVSHVHLAEYDLVPLTANLGLRLIGWMEEQNADLIGSGLSDLTETIHPHYLNFQKDEGVRSFIRGISCREEKQRVLTMLGCTSFWSSDCLKAVAAQALPGSIYLELALPTIAHHLGYRVRPLPEAQQNSITFEGDLLPCLEHYRDTGAWMLHPCKNRW